MRVYLKTALTKVQPLGPGQRLHIFVNLKTANRLLSLIRHFRPAALPLPGMTGRRGGRLCPGDTHLS